jgi:hypothetical protein
VLVLLVHAANLHTSLLVIGEWSDPLTDYDPCALQISTSKHMLSYGALVVIIMLDG